MSEFSIAILISGGGTTLRNLIEKKSNSLLDAEIKLVISSNPDARGLGYATDAQITHAVFDYRKFKSPESLSKQIFERCRQESIDLVVLAGFLRKLVIPGDFENRVINIHPSLIPAFCGTGYYGLRVHRAVIENESKITGCTVHFVDNQYDHGPIIAQESVKVAPDDTPESLAARVFERECALYPKVINAIANGQIAGFLKS